MLSWGISASPSISLGEWPGRLSSCSGPLRAPLRSACKASAIPSLRTFALQGRTTLPATCRQDIGPARGSARNAEEGDDENRRESDGRLSKAGETGNPTTQGY